MNTLVCVPISVQDPNQALLDAEQACAAGADLVEFRVDAFAESLMESAEDPALPILDLVAGSALGCVMTCRPSWEGGDYHGDEQSRLDLLERLVADPGGPLYVDIELASFDRSPGLAERLCQARERGSAGLILSVHDFEGRPTDLSRRVASAVGLGIGDVIKVAYRARSLRDNLELFELLRAGHRPTIALGMGRFGLPSRVLAPKFGGFLTFASLRDEAATAPGQPTISELLGGYRFRSIGAKSRVFGVVGWPIEQSLSPMVHNAGFEWGGFDGVYLPLPVASGDDAEDSWVSFKGTLGAWIDDSTLSFSGASVTIPHKQNLVRFARERGFALDRLSELCGAANTLVRDDAGEWNVYNTDGPAAIDPLVDVLGGIEGKTVCVLGAGGAARAVVYEALSRGACVIICNRSADRAERLVAEARGSNPQCDVRAVSLESVSRADALVNCTPVGMAGGVEGSPISERALSAIEGLKVVEDTVYNPPETSLVKMATNLGVRAFGGAEMFVRQAGAQFQLFTGSDAPRELFMRIVREELDGKE